jgi:hypothetical protein
MSSSNISAAIDEAGKVTKKQKLCATKVSDALDRLIQLAQQSRQQLEAGSDDAVAQVQAQAEQLGLLKEMNSSTKELHSSINKLSKVSGRAGGCPSCCLCATADSTHTCWGLATPMQHLQLAVRSLGAAAGRPSTPRVAPSAAAGTPMFLLGAVLSCCSDAAQALEKAFDTSTDICKALKDTQFDTQTLNKVGSCARGEARGSEGVSRRGGRHASQL